jgi:environmental stress-induced protein Ves
MQIIPATDFITMPWKNGGGVTHEILKHEDNGQLLWRLSIAEVSSDGPFSIFAGLSRILTVILGEGLALSAPHTELSAMPLVPLAFSGDWPITSTRRSPVVEDFNVIFDDSRVAVNVKVWRAGVSVDVLGDDGGVAIFLLLGTSEIAGQILTPKTVLIGGPCVSSVQCSGAIIETRLRLRV